MKTTENSQIDAAALSELRAKSGLSVRDFWASVGLNHNTGYSYEKGVTRIPNVVRRIVYLHYVLGFDTNITKTEYRKLGVKNAVRQ